MPPPSDEELVERYRALSGTAEGEDAVNQLFERHYQRVGLWCYRLVGNRETAADLAQEIFGRVFQHLDAFRGDSKFTTWLYTITRNHCWGQMKSRKPDVVEDSEQFLASLADTSAKDLQKTLETGELAKAMRKMMGQELTKTELQVMTLHYVEELPLAAVTKLLALENASGAKAHIVSAKRKIAVALRRWRSRNSMESGDGQYEL